MLTAIKKWFKELEGCNCRNCTYTRKHGGYAVCIAKAGELPEFIPPKRKLSNPPKNPSGKSDFHEQFEKWFKAKHFFSQLVFIHGDRLFLRDEHVYRLLVVQIAYEAWMEVPGCNQVT